MFENFENLVLLCKKILTFHHFKTKFRAWANT